MKFKACSWRNVVWVMILVIVYITQVGSVQATEDGVPQEQVMTLVWLDLNSAWNENVFKLWDATRVVDDSGQLFYKIPSLDGSHPHYVRIGINGKINLAKITVDYNNQSKIELIYKSLGEPELIVGRSESEMLYGFPSKGYGFVINEYSGKIVKLLRFAPKTVDLFMVDEAKAYQSVDLVSKPSQGEAQINLIENTKLSYISRIKRLLLVGLVITAIVTLWRGFFKPKKKRRF